ncbi:MAG: hypothetical protein O7C65_00960 [Planctomycetota bacterium]|nr:hypothetical protein [Planctomycetota bacterium]
MSYMVHKLTQATAILAVVMAVVVLQLSSSAYAGETIKFDVAEDPTRFVFDKNGPLVESGLPDYGNPFVTQGYIYPYGTLVGDDPGVDVNGKPLYPDKVIGEWTCYGFIIGEGANTKTGPIIISEQVYSFGEEAGSKTLISNGYELADLNKPFLRAITGGTGPYVGARGQVTETLLAESKYHSVTFRFEIVLSD